MALTRAAQYLRMSTEHQRYSPEHQAAAISVYAAARGYDVVRTYRDDGISGVGIRNREGLKSLLADVMAGEAGFETILVYDVSRWGRFQNPDQSAHYEFLCAEAGVRVEYCAEPFDNDGSTGSTILKALRRVMAAEYSRELSQRVSLAKRRFAAQGYWQGGPPGYGLRRLVVTASDEPVRVLEAGEFKLVQGHHCVLVAGPQAEIDVVRRIYRAYVDGHMSQFAIMRRLNAQGVHAAGGAAWTYGRVHQILSNPKYTGTMVSLRWVKDLGGRQRQNPPANWIVVQGAAPQIVSRKLFEAARKRLALANVQWSDADLLGALRRLHARTGLVTFKGVGEAPDMPSPWMYLRRFGTLGKACDAAGLPHRRKLPKGTRGMPAEEVVRRLKALLAKEGRLSYRLLAADPGLPAPMTVSRMFGSLTNAYALAGFVRMGARQRASPVGEARARAAQARAAGRP